MITEYMIILQDHHAFEKQLDEDVAAGKKPLIVLGVVGSSILGQNDMISKLLELRKNKHRFWLHIVGQVWTNPPVAEQV